jgi:predicted AlkP superfamily phosphohydrolase/phosphomutase/tetratricopeptide (TPR) repeat protein
LLIGWDAADWKTIEPLLHAGQMPNLARLIAEGAHGNLATIYPVLSPMLWTSIATGKRAYKHGIHGFVEPLPNGAGVRAVTILSRTTKTIWNILNQNGRRSLVVGWWPSHPAEPINGVMVSNHFPHAEGEPGAMSPPAAGTVHPPELAGALAELRVHPMELTGEFIRPFVPEYDKVNQAKDKRLHTLGNIIAETMSVHAAATELLATQSCDFAAIYYSGLDHFQHAFMRYHPPRLPWVPDEDFAIYQHVVANGYRYHDAMLGALLEFADANTTVVLLSDHGFHPDHLRPGYIPAEPAGPAVEHRHFGVLCLKGPAVRANEQIFGASVLDICPTVLTLFGLPPGRDMDGKVLLTAFKEPPAIEPIESWDQVPGDTGTHPPEKQVDAVASAQAFKQLVDLGYIAPPSPNAQEAVAECVRELKYNLARSYRDANCCGEAAALAEEMWTRWPKEHRFGILLVECLLPLRQVVRRRAAIEELSRRLDRYQAEARTELERRRVERSKYETQEAKPEVKQPSRARFEERQLRELAEGRPLLIEWLLVSQALLEKNHTGARRQLGALTQVEGASNGHGRRIAAALAELGDLESARALLADALKLDPENAPVHAQLATLHFKAGRFDQAIASATDSLSLLYFQPGLHALLGQALMETKRFAEAEQALLVAVAQSPRNLVAHELLARLYRDHLDRPNEAFAQEGRARSLRHELAQQLAGSARVDATPETPATCTKSPSMRLNGLAAPFGPEVESGRVITVVSGLPRSGTSMMIQVLVAAGREVLTDGKRGPDEDNPLGYFEFEKAPALAQDASWIPQARGKVVKIIAQLLPFLPPGEYYQIIFMERDLAEIIASQAAMLARQGRRGAELDGPRLATAYTAHLERLRGQLSRRHDIRLLSLDYNEFLAKPEAEVKRVAAFLGKPFNTAASAAVRPELRRHKA